MPAICVYPAELPVREQPLWQGAHHQAEFECKRKKSREGILILIHILVQLWQRLHDRGSIMYLSGHASMGTVPPENSQTYS